MKDDFPYGWVTAAVIILAVFFLFIATVNTYYMIADRADRHYCDHVLRGGK